MTKKIIFILIDSFMPHIFREARQKKMIPTLSSLAARGAFWDNCVSVFPTVSASIDSSLMCGCYPEEHAVPGLVWYSHEEKRIVNYINGWKAVWRMGLTRCAEDVLIGLNEQHLNPNTTTIFEELARDSKTCASINMAVHRAEANHRVTKPGLMRWVLWKLKRSGATGPSVCSMGNFIPSYGRPLPWSFNQSIFKKYGLNDSFAIDIACRMIKEDRLADFTAIYLSDSDFAYHRNPEKGAAILAKVDKQIGRLVNSFGGFEQALQRCRFIITGDHGQTKVKARKEGTINLERFFFDKAVAFTKTVNPDKDDFVICNNERACYFYPLKDGVLEEIVHRLKKEERIDLLAWKKHNGVHVQHGEKSLYFSPAAKGQSKGGGDGNDESGSLKQAIDPYGRKWVLEGDLSVIDAVLREEGTSPSALMEYGKYPDICSRLYGALYAREGQVIVATAVPGCEFITKHDAVHRGGACHGSLHTTDSIVPLMITDEEPDAFKNPRLVDLKTYIINNLSG
ncbi:alkaline phosphatase family protein [Aneurinibacillus terranovensis]|uniref:alkaline phosphatase family protein n=1 Tax=Aneurinibacillus terranovensis TaxID=278991 RepID=UPI0004885ED6|nr:alkaline phosphatase family protein [Aneurinibacillus terranovensis]